MLGYAWGSEAMEDAKYLPSFNKQFAIVSIHALRDALFEGIDRYLIDLFKDPNFVSDVDAWPFKVTIETPCHHPFIETMSAETLKIG